MGKNLVLEEKPFHPPVRQTYLEVYKTTFERTGATIRAFSRRVSVTYGDEFKRWWHNNCHLVGVIALILACLVPLLPKPIFLAIRTVLLVLVSICFFIGAVVMLLAFPVLFTYYFITAIFTAQINFGSRIRYSRTKHLKKKNQAYHRSFCD